MSESKDNKLLKVNSDMSELLEKYKNILVTYEDSRQKYEQIIKEYENDSTDSDIKCNRIVGYLINPRVITWEIILLTGDIIYKSEHYIKDETWIIELANIDIRPGTRFNIRASHDESGDTCNKIFIYTPDSNTTAYMQLDIDYSWGTFTAFLGVVPLYYEPFAEPYLNCVGLTIVNRSGVLCRYALIDMAGKMLYESSHYSQDTIWTISFQDIGIEPETVFIIKALVDAGEDSICDVTMKYVPDSYYRAKFQLSGITTKNQIVYQGTSYFNPGPLVTIKASNVVAYNLAGVISKWQILRLDGSVFYTSGNVLQYETWAFDLKSLMLPEGTTFRVKSVITTRGDKVSAEIFEYSSIGGTPYYKYNISPTGELIYNGLIESNEKPPVIKCSSIVAKHTEYPVIMRWKILSAETNEVIYESGRCAKGNTWTYALSSLGVAPGKLLKLKASVTAGADSIAYVIIEYDPTSYHKANFGFYGNAFKTIVTYEG